MLYWIKERCIVGFCGAPHYSTVHYSTCPCHQDSLLHTCSTRQGPHMANLGAECPKMLHCRPDPYWDPYHSTLLCSGSDNSIILLFVIWTSPKRTSNDEEDYDGFNYEPTYEIQSYLLYQMQNITMVAPPYSFCGIVLVLSLRFLSVRMQECRKEAPKRIETSERWEHWQIWCWM